MQKERVFDVADKVDDWEKVAAILREVLPEIDRVLSQANIPIAVRPSKAFGIIRATMLEISDYGAFLASDVPGRFLVIVGDWYRNRYGGAVDTENENFGTIVLIYDTPFAMSVPKAFETRAEEPSMVWIGWPASVQPEEDPLCWVENHEVINGLSANERNEVRKIATKTANLIRSIGFDLCALEHEADANVADLAGAIGADLQASARHLCMRSEAGLRAAGWDVSQATEKALKLFVRRKGEAPPHTHDLHKLADRADALSAMPVDRRKLASIPSNKDATNMRYGGHVELSTVVSAYMAALPIVRELLFEVKPESNYNIREARLKVQRPPWFDFDIEAFRTMIRRQY